jgi:predicted nucleic acid-binding protein
MSRVTALLDANILYPAPVRDLMMQLALDDLFHARWTADIHREWIEALLRKEPQRDRTRLERTRDLMNQHTRDALIVGYEALIPCLQLPDPDDRHVLAAAITGRCDVIVTQNLSDFPDQTLQSFGLYAVHPDDFLLDYCNRDLHRFCRSVKHVRSRLKNPEISPSDYLAILTRQDLKRTAGALEKWQCLL